MSALLIAIATLFWPLAGGDSCAYRYPCEDIAFVQRQHWAARPATDTAYQHDLPVPYAIVHHTVTGRCRRKPTCARIVANLQSFHMDHLSYDDIAYK